jgi:hypothetical protein
MENNSRQLAFKFFVNPCLIYAIYYFVAERIKRPVEVDGGYREIMGTFARIVAVAKNEGQAKRCVEAGFDELRRIDADERLQPIRA